LLVKWIAQCSLSANVLNDRDFIKLITAGQSGLTLLSAATAACNIKTIVEGSHEKIKKLLIDHPGCLHFATDAWMSPNHQAFVAWTVHFKHDGHMLTFFLNVVEVTQSHTRSTFAAAFQKMFIEYGIQEKVLSVNSNNTSSNDNTQTHLASHNNSFNEEACLCCFNHTVSLACKELPKPFNPALGTAPCDEDHDDNDELSDHDNKDDEDKDVGGISNADDDGIDKLEVLTA
jgi:hypothetical protein